MPYRSPQGDILRQSDILHNISTFVVTEIKDDQPRGELLKRTYSIVLTQDCDLEQDYKARFDGNVKEDKMLFGVLLCGVYPEASVKAGTHREGAQSYGSKEWKPLERGGEPRYQHLGYVPQAGLTLVADFKDFFIVPGDYLYSSLKDIANPTCRLAEINTPYREYIMQRFAWYIMRIGLPTQFHLLTKEKHHSPNLDPTT
jgi:hypothetical protein